MVSTPIITTTSESIIRRDERDSSLEPFPYKSEPQRQKRSKCAPPPSPSRFIKGEFRESDYESDYEGRIPPVWGSDADRCYKPVRPILTPSGRHSQASARTPTPPTAFDQPPNFNGPPRPKFEPIEKPSAAIKINEVLTEKTSKTQVVHKPKPLTPRVMEVIVATPAVPLRPGSPPKMDYAPGPKTTQYYRSTTSAPYQNAVQTETSNVMHLKESSEHCHRSVSLQQTHKVITFGNQQQKSFKQTSTPTPTKFIKGEFRDSDYESKINSSWTSGDSDTGELRFRRVKPPQTTRHISVPIQKERVVSPMEFDTQPPLMPRPTDHSNSVGSMKKRFEETDSNQIVRYTKSSEGIKPGSPPEYGFVPEKSVRSTATKIASKHMEDMTHQFKSKAQQFAHEIMTDVNKKTEKPLPKKSGDGDAQVYREESRAAQYGGY